MLADIPGIRKSCQNMGIGKAYTLFTAMLTARPFDEIMERSKTGSLAVPNQKKKMMKSPGTKDDSDDGGGVVDSREDKAMIRGYAQHFLKDIIVLLGTVPKQMLLLLKMNDCIRHINYALGSPTNTLVVAGKYASRAVYEHESQKRMTGSVDARDARDIVNYWKARWRAWFEYTMVSLRIQLYDLGLWLSSSSN